MSELGSSSNAVVVHLYKAPKLFFLRNDARLHGRITVDGLSPNKPRLVHVFDRKTNNLLDAFYTDAQGRFDRLNALKGRSGQALFVVYDEADTSYQPIVKDFIQGVAQDNVNGALLLDLRAEGSDTDIPDGDAVTRVRGVISENYQPVSRVVRVYDYHSNRFIGETVSDPVTGEYEVNTSPYTGEVMRLVMQDYGQSYQPTHDYEVGDIVHPSTANGYVFQCSVPGLSGDVEPEWSNDGLTVVTTGESSFSPIEFYRPIMDGPVKPVVVG